MLQWIKEKPPKTRKVRLESDTSISRPKNATRVYTLNGVDVCKEVFEKTLGLNSGRITRLLQKRTEHNITPTDGRGRHNFHPKVSEEVKGSLDSLVKRIPKYKSHYTFKEDEKYLAPGLRKVDIYNLWENECSKQFLGQIPSYEWFLGYWKENFNLKVHRPSTDCCSTCDQLNSNGSHDELKQHHLEAAEARKTFSEDSKDPHTITFDMQKTQPLPHLNTNKAFYLRQLWLYNLGIHHTYQKQGYMYCWIEGTAKRGSNEVGSCLKKFINDECKDWENLILWSDCCGGQNRNVNITSFLISLVNDTSFKFQKIVHRFMWSGHSYLPNDSDFSFIEKKKNAALSISSANEYIYLIKSARKTRPFKVHQMLPEDFNDISQLSSNYLKAKMTTDKEPMKISKMHEMIYERGLFGYRFRNSYFDTVVKTVDMQKRLRSSGYTIANIPPLYPEGVAISQKKYNDLMELLKFVPPIYHDFYKSLRHDGQEEETLMYPDSDNEAV